MPQRQHSAALKFDLLPPWQLKAFSFKKSSAGRSTLNRMSLNKKCNLGVCLSQRGMSVYKSESGGKQLVHTKVERCQLQIDDLICLMDGASALRYLPSCQHLSSGAGHCRALPFHSAPHETHSTPVRSQEKVKLNQNASDPWKERATKFIFAKKPICLVFILTPYVNLCRYSMITVECTECWGRATHCCVLQFGYLISQNPDPWNKATS